MPSRKWLLVDGSSLIFRSFYATSKEVRSPDGRLVNAMGGTVDALSRLVRSRKPAMVAIGGDADWRPQARVDLIATYKAHRVAEPVPPDLIAQLPLIEELLAAIGIPIVNVRGLEAEDVIASWVSQLDAPVEIYSGDRDLFALIRDPDVRVLYPERTGLSEIDEAEITKRYGIPGRRYGDFAILRGDPSDGLPGLKGVGAVSAAAMIRKFATVEALLDSNVLTDGQREYVTRAMVVVRPQKEPQAPLPEVPVRWPADPKRLQPLADSLGIASSVGGLCQVLEMTIHAGLDVRGM